MSKKLEIVERLLTLFNRIMDDKGEKGHTVVISGTLSKPFRAEDLVTFDDPIKKPPNEPAKKPNQKTIFEPAHTLDVDLGMEEPAREYPKCSRSPGWEPYLEFLTLKGECKQLRKEWLEGRAQYMALSERTGKRVRAWLSGNGPRPESGVPFILEDAPARDQKPPKDKGPQVPKDASNETYWLLWRDRMKKNAVLNRKRVSEYSRMYEALSVLAGKVLMGDKIEDRNPQELHRWSTMS